MSERMGISGRIASRFLTTEITPLLGLIGLLLGLFAIIVTPREEEPQINVTFANIFVAYPGASAREVERLISTPAEQVLSEIDGIKHVYSVSRPGMSILTVQFRVGEDRDNAILRLYNALASNQDWLPRNLGAGQPLIKPKGIDDVPIVTFTLWTRDEKRSAAELRSVAHALEAELKRVPGTRDIYTIGGPRQVVQVSIDPQRLAAYGIALQDLRRSLQASNQSRNAGALVNNNREILVQAGTFLLKPQEIAGLVIGVRDGQPVYLRDVADIRLGPEQPAQYVWFGGGMAGKKSDRGEYPAVTLAIAKKPGTNAVDIARQVIHRMEQLKGVVIPAGVEVTVTRNYGATANAKAQTLIGKLIFATAAVVLLVLLTMGWREAVIVGVAVVITLAVTLFASWAWGFTLNRVSLFALIFSIGILVDDAIVVVENIHRHIQMGGRKLLELIPAAVDEVGGPTILATLTVIAALLPMAFVTGLMGPYMSPIPINASIGMLLSLAIAFIITPWLSGKLVREGHQGGEHESSAGRLGRFFERIIQPFLNGRQGMFKRAMLGLSIVILIVLSLWLAVGKLVVLKMLPFDNKSELQIVIDMPEGTSLEQTARVTRELGQYLVLVPEVEHYQAYVGAASPISFNGLVRQYYLRRGANVGDIQVTLAAKSKRDRKSHDIALAIRGPLQKIGKRHGANIKIVEVPPGPPVMSPLVAEVYGLDYEGQIRVAQRVRKVFASTPDIIDIDDSIEHRSEKLVIRVDRQQAALSGISQQLIVQAIATGLGGEDVGYLHSDYAKYPIPLRLVLPLADKADISRVLAIKLRGSNGKLVPLSELVRVVSSKREISIYHKDLLPVVYVTGDMAGKLDSPLYGMFEMYGKLQKFSVEGGEILGQNLISQPDNPLRYSIKWDGEWQVTYETFRDMGIAYSVGLLMIFLLVVAQFRSYVVPLIIMAPIPLTIIGVMPGHALLGAKFTATSMIGMIALAGIIVRNSILLVDFINEQVRTGMDFEKAVIQSAAVRARPILLTGLAAMLGAFFILDDPIFSGLAISLIFGILVSMLLTLLVIPVLYYAAMYRRPGFHV
jgi:multidrug efflux pump subunit AcrB